METQNKSPFPPTKYPSIGIIILAAGAARRMGQVKQLLKIAQKTLIERTIEAATSLENSSIVVVLGANAEKIKPIITAKKVHWILNKNWSKGMGSSIKTGVHFLLSQNPNLEAIIISVCDQPYLNATIFNQLITTFQQTNASIVAASYEKIIGVPALFERTLFDKLQQLDGEEGAKKIIKNFSGKIATIDFPKGLIDLDTPEAYQQFLEDFFKNPNSKRI